MIERDGEARATELRKSVPLVLMADNRKSSGFSDSAFVVSVVPVSNHSLTPVDTMTFLAPTSGILSISEMTKKVSDRIPGVPAECLVIHPVSGCDIAKPYTGNNCASLRVCTCICM